MANLKPISEINILVVDDTSVVLTMLTALLMGLGFRKIITVQNVESALEKIPRFQACPFDVIFLDRYLGNQSGLEILKYVRERDKVVPIVMLTQEDEGSKVIEAIALGASDYIVKPFTEDIVVKKLEQALGKPLK